MIKKIGESEKIKFWEEKIGEWRQSGLMQARPGNKRLFAYL